jgi:hypothetical protein
MKFGGCEVERLFGFYGLMIVARDTDMPPAKGA